jgi:hypothetical protein
MKRRRRTQTRKPISHIDVTRFINTKFVMTFNMNSSNQMVDVVDNKG